MDRFDLDMEAVIFLHFLGYIASQTSLKYFFIFFSLVRSFRGLKLC